MMHFAFGKTLECKAPNWRSVELISRRKIDLKTAKWQLKTPSKRWVAPDIWKVILWDLKAQSSRFQLIPSPFNNDAPTFDQNRRKPASFCSSAYFMDNVLFSLSTTNEITHLPFKDETFSGNTARQNFGKSLNIHAGRRGTQRSEFAAHKVQSTAKSVWTRYLGDKGGSLF